MPRRAGIARGPRRAVPGTRGRAGRTRARRPLSTAHTRRARGRCSRRRRRSRSPVPGRSGERRPRRGSRALWQEVAGCTILRIHAAVSFDEPFGTLADLTAEQAGVVRAPRRPRRRRPERRGARDDADGAGARAPTDGRWGTPVVSDGQTVGTLRRRDGRAAGPVLAAACRSSIHTPARRRPRGPRRCRPPPVPRRRRAAGPASGRGTGPRRLPAPRPARPGRRSDRRPGRGGP